MMVAALQAGGEFGRVAPGVASSIASMPGSGYSPMQADRLAVGTGTQTAGGTFSGLGATLANALDQTGMNVAGREKIAGDDRAAEAALAERGFDAFTNGMRGIQPNAQSALERLQGVVGPLEITSGYRDPEHNAAVGGAKGSEHIHGNAFDVSTRGMSDEERTALIAKARAAGFKGIGVYDNSLHFDVGADRAWGPDYHRGSLPEWAAGAVSSPVGGGGAAPEEMIDPRAMELLIGAGTPGMSSNQSRIMSGLADEFFPDDLFGVDGGDEKVPALSAGGRTTLLNALLPDKDTTTDEDRAVAMNIVAQVDQMVAGGMNENEAIAYALQSGNQNRTEPVTTDSWWPGDEETVPGRLTGIKTPDQGVGNEAAAILQEARDAIAAGAPTAAVIERLKGMGIDTSGL
jgi:hypothetical protein